MIKPYPLPVFKNGIALSALELNIISEAQSFLDGSFGLLNFPFQRTERDVPIYGLHRFRYLHVYSAAAAPTAVLYINGHSAGTPLSGGTHAVIDLGFGFNGGSSNPYSLTLNQPYSLIWGTGAIDCRLAFEHVSSSGTLSLPTSVPSFSGVLQDSQLNQICTNTQYLIDACIVPATGFTAQDYGLGTGQKTLLYSMYKYHRYLHMEAFYRPSGDISNPKNNDFIVRIDGTSVFADIVVSDHTASYYVVFDLEGSSSVNYGTDGYFTNTVHPSGIYDISLTAEGDDPNASLTTLLICESPYATRL
jgi:hypothetical protein